MLCPPARHRLVAALLASTFAGQSFADVDEDGVKVEVTLDYVSQYFFRGAEQLDSDQGVVLQPGIEFTVPVVTGDGYELSAIIGTWGSIHTNTDGPPVTPVPGSGPANPTSWFEQDLYASLDLIAGPVEASVGLTYYTFPSNASNISVTELSMRLGLDDSRWLGTFALHPYVLATVDLQNNNVSEASYLELGGEMRFDMSEAYDLPLVWTVPFAVGLSLNDWYINRYTTEDELYGHTRVGLMGTIPLSEVIGTENWLGAWDLTAGVMCYFLNSDIALTDDFNGSSDNFQLVAKVGISREW